MRLYCDTSSLVKLYIAEPGSDEVRTLCAEASVVVSSELAYVETRAALARLRRNGSVTSALFSRAKARFDADWITMLSIAMTSELLRTAGTLAERHNLRALDAIHLASFAALLERSTDEDVHFSSFDERLTRAARRLR
jgi:predicted nucleic acid-binding protein